MVLYVIRWNVHPDKGDAYTAFTQRAIACTLAVPGVVEFRGYRPASGDSQVIVTYEFVDMAWNSDNEFQEVMAELRTLATDVTMELWGPSTVVPQPIWPGG